MESPSGIKSCANVEFFEEGDGPALLFVPGSFGTSAAWRGIKKQLPQRLRMISTSLRGYGSSDETRSRDDYGIGHNIDLLAAVAARVGEPAHVIAHSWGAVVSLAAIASGGLKAASLTTFEATPPSLLLYRNRPDLLDAMRDLAGRLAEAHCRGEPDAVAAVIDYWGGPGSFGAMPGKVQEYCRMKAETNILDWLGYLELQPSPAELRRIDIPVLLVRGSAANEAMVEITAGLGELLPRSTTSIIESASHFLISSHPQECARLLSEFIGAVARVAGRHNPGRSPRGPTC